MEVAQKMKNLKVKDSGNGKTESDKRKPSNEIITKPPKLTSKKGSGGQPVKLYANYFKLLSSADWCLYQYRVDINPEEERTWVKKSLLYQHRKVLGAYLFDGTVLYTCNRLKQPLELNSIREEDKSPIQFKIKLVGDVMKGDYHYFQVHSILVRKSFEHLDLKLVGRNFFDDTKKEQVIEFKLEVWPGYVTSIRQHDGGVLMNSEISHKVMRMETVYDILMSCQRRRPNEYQKLFKEDILSTVVLTTYNNKTYRVDDVDFKVSPASTFQKRDGSKISYADYYQNRYQLKIKNMTQPMLVSKSKARDIRAGQAELVYLVPELCRATGITQDMRTNMKLMIALAEKTRVAPEDRIRKLLEFNQRLLNTKAIVEDYKNWDFKIDSKLIELDARIITPEVISYGNNRNVPANNGDFTHQLQESSAVKSNALNDWYCIVETRALNQAKTFIDTMISLAKRLGFTIARPKLREIKDDRLRSYADALETLTSQTKPQLILVIVPNNNLERYSMIKKKLCCDRPIPSQVLMNRTISHSKPNMLNSVATKVAIQLNCKLGGIPWTITLPTAVRGLMVVGFDVCHDKNSRNHNFGAMVASLDQHFGTYFSSVTRHESGEELSNNLAAQLEIALKVFMSKNANKFPSRVIIYRDGVGEGQIPFVKEVEVEQIKKMMANFHNGDMSKVKLSFVVVTKRINTRLFLMSKRNPPPGTVVDDVITDPLKYDFFLISQSVRQGTVSPTAYNIIEDTSGLSPVAMQGLAYKFCHMYYNFSGTVRVPAPCQYAHKLALLVSQALNKPPHPDLQNQLYFL